MIYFMIFKKQDNILHEIMRKPLSRKIKVGFYTKY